MRGSLVVVIMFIVSISITSISIPDFVHSVTDSSLVVKDSFNENEINSIDDSTSASDIEWVEHTLTSGTDDITSVYAIDIDNDTDVDILGATNFKIFVYENDGALFPSFTERTIPTAIAVNSMHPIHPNDIDLDGDIDIVAATWNKVFWFENDGSNPASWTERLVYDAREDARSVFSVDVDGDTDIDILVASHENGQIIWFENDGNNPPGWTRR